MLNRDLGRLKDTFAGKPIAIVSPGPTLVELEKLDPYAAAIFLGDAHLRTSHRARSNYYVRANSVFPRLTVPSEILPLIDEGFHICIAESVMETEIAVEYLIRDEGLDLLADFTLFDQRHFEGRPCNPVRKCCDSINKPTIQEFLANSLGLKHHYSQGATVLLHAIALGLLMNPRSISIFGASLPLRQSEYTYAPSRNLVSSQSRIRFQSLKPSNVIKSLKNPKSVRFQLARLILGDDAPSIFAEDFVDLVADLQYLSDAASFMRVRLESKSEISTLNAIRGIVID